jgi:hypothetical protein
MKPENSCTITLTESELNLLVSGLVVFEREQLRLANLAQEEGSTLEAEARASSASKIKQLADRIANTTCRIGLADAVNAPTRERH